MPVREGAARGLTSLLGQSGSFGGHDMSCPYGCFAHLTFAVGENGVVS